MLLIYFRQLNDDDDDIVYHYKLCQLAYLAGATAERRRCTEQNAHAAGVSEPITVRVPTPLLAVLRLRRQGSQSSFDLRIRSARGITLRRAPSRAAATAATGAAGEMPAGWTGVQLLETPRVVDTGE